MLSFFNRGLFFALAGGSFVRATDISGTVTSARANQSIEFVAVTLKKTDGAVVQSTVTDARGRFTLEKVPVGDYILAYNLVGGNGRTSSPFTVGAASARLDFGQLNLEDAAVKMEKFEVNAKAAAQLNSIDRKTYFVGKEIQSATGSASDLLQNIPSIQVDIDGNISLRGSENVMILLDGRTSTMMGRSRAEVLQQLPADAIEKIEVITNPSAKYKPDGTAGIINITLKKKSEGRFSSVATASAGNRERYSAGFSANYHPSGTSLFGSASLRQDDRERRGSDVRVFTDPISGLVTRAEKKTVEHSRPLSRLLRAGLDYSFDEHNQLGLAGNYNHRTFNRSAIDYHVLSDARSVRTADFDRSRYDPELETSLEVVGTYQHKVAQEDHALSVEVKASRQHEVEDNRYTNFFRIPAQAPTYDNILIKNDEHGAETVVGYTYPVSDQSKFEAGYTHTESQLEQNFAVSNRDPFTGQMIADKLRSNRFRHDETIEAFYATLGRTFGKFGLLAGLRPEWARVNSHLVNTGATIPNNYARIYPSLHLAYQPTPNHELQWNYSHRVHRPESEDLNPFSEYVDPFNLRAGNPRLRPEDIHSIEAGYAFKKDNHGVTSTVYHRALYHGFTSVTRSVGQGVLLTTKENLAESQSTGCEITAHTDIGKRASLTFSSNTFFNTIDASNLGFKSSQSAIAWSAKIGATLHLPRETLMQLNSNYTAARLTPQGSRLPAFVANLGIRHTFLAKKAAAVLTISDLSNSLKETTRIDTPALRQEIIRRRSSRIVYIGFSYTFGKPSKKSKDDALKFDNAL